MTPRSTHPVRLFLVLTLTLAASFPALACRPDCEPAADGPAAKLLAELPAESPGRAYVEGLLSRAGQEAVPKKSGGRCSDYDPLRSPFFGDLHVHTSFSMDSIYFGGGLDSGPATAYRFALGEPVGIAPFDPAGNALRTVQLTRPLDFAAVTDHAEYFGETRICFSPGHPGYDSPECDLIRERLPFNAFAVWFGPLLQTVPPGPGPRFDFCGPDEANCLDVAADVWEETKNAAEAAYDRSSDCSFTSFLGYEWTGTPGTANQHRNVIFATDEAPDLPVSFLDSPLVEGLWESIRTDCIEADGTCDAVVIPHNTNLSAARGVFLPENSDGAPLTAADAARRAEMEPLVEIVQHKGASECRPGVGTTDETCDFALVEQTSIGFPGAPQPPQSPFAYVRHGLKVGLAQEAAIGVNPFRLGFVGGTDTHNSTPGFVDEPTFAGHLAVLEATLPGRLALGGNPGGLTVIWAEENSRESLFTAMKRREVYATSGPRIVVRMFGGFLYPEPMCDTPAFVQLGYALGVPMGGVLEPPPGIAEHQAPRFAVSALRDPGTAESPGTRLQRIQIVKGWVDENGEAQEAVYEVAGDPENGAGVDPATGQPTGPGFDSLCTVWEDPDFEADAPAFYYARVLENPTWSWSSWQCHAAGVDCDDPGTIPPGHELCCAESREAVLQERAWGSPIWYSPSASDDAP